MVSVICDIEVFYRAIFVANDIAYYTYKLIKGAFALGKNCKSSMVVAVRGSRVVCELCCVHSVVWELRCVGVALFKSCVL